MTTVTIGGREFRIRATYVSKRPRDKTRPRTLCVSHPWQPEGKVRLMTPGGYTQYWSAEVFARWAGDEVAPMNPKDGDAW